MLKSPTTFAEAAAYIEQKQDKPTADKSKVIAAAWDAETKARAFFSSRVATADILTVLHQRCSQVVNGAMTTNQAAELLRRWMEGDGSGLLAELGFLPPSKSTDSVAELGSVRRLRLIVEQNAKMAQEVGHYQQWQETAEATPFGVWHTGVSEEHREAHVARNGRAYPHDHAVWTTDPPGGLFNCHCWREEITAAEARRRGLKPEALGPVIPPEGSLGFDPSRGMPAEPPPIKPATLSALKAALAGDFDDYLREHDADQAEFALARQEAKAEQVSDSAAAVAAWGKNEAARLRRNEQARLRRKRKAAAATSGGQSSAADADVFPDDPDTSVSVVKKLGGSTGAELVRAADGRLFVRKRGATPEHLRSEYYADAAYRAAGVRVPLARLYETASGPVKLAEYKTGTSLKSWLAAAKPGDRDRMLSELQKGLHVDAVLGNWDVIGMDGDNVLVDERGAPWRIDNGGALSFRAMGSRKTADEWNAYPKEFWSLRESGQGKPVFGGADYYQVMGAAANTNWGAVARALPKSERKVFVARAREAQRLGNKALDMQHTGWAVGYADEVGRHITNLRGEGFHKFLPKRVAAGEFGTFRTKSAFAAPDVPTSDSVIGAFTALGKTVNNHAGDKGYNQTTVANAEKLGAALKKVAGKGGDADAAAAKQYLDYLEKCKKAMSEGGKVPFAPLVSFSPQAFAAEAAGKPRYASATAWLHDYIKRQGSDPAQVIKWQGDQASDSWRGGAVAWKWLAHEQLPDMDGVFWGHGYEAAKDAAKAAIPDMDKARKAFAAYNAGVQVALDSTGFEHNDRKRRAVYVVRTERKEVMRETGAKAYGKNVTMKTRGLCESTSIWEKTTVHGREDQVTMQAVPHDRVLGVYFFERVPGSGGGAFLGDSENEFDCVLPGIPMKYADTYKGNKGEDAAKWDVPLGHLRK